MNYNPLRRPNLIFIFQNANASMDQQTSRSTIQQSRNTSSARQRRRQLQQKAVYGSSVPLFQWKPVCTYILMLVRWNSHNFLFMYSKTIISVMFDNSWNRWQFTSSCAVSERLFASECLVHYNFSQI